MIGEQNNNIIIKKDLATNGIDPTMGIVPRTIMSCFEYIKIQSQKFNESTLKMSFVEIYKEEVYDLLSPKGTDQAAASKVIPMTGPDGSIYLTNTSEINIKEAGHALNVFSQGSMNRHTAHTAMNDRSSRSHAIVIFTYTSRNPTKNSKVLSQLYLCDLAGSENVSRSAVQGDALIESGLINRSLH
jgi:hypothetical protein